MDSFIELFVENGKNLEGIDTAVDTLIKENKFNRKNKAALAAFYRYIETHYPSYLSEENRCLKFAKRLNNNEFARLWNHLLSNRKNEAIRVLEYFKKGRGDRRLITIATANDGILKLYTNKEATEDDVLWLKGAIARAYIAPQAGLVQRTFKASGKMEVEGLLFSKGKCWPIPASSMKKMTQTEQDGTLSILPEEEFITPSLTLPMDNYTLGEAREGYFPTDKGEALISRVARDYRDTALEELRSGQVGSFLSYSL
ncbi:MAG: hypothetical protein K6G51_01205 [Sphaerochaetaceae bacterium]|nr:hypothetical protein [Sphaerochaetaceae bacterium]